MKISESRLKRIIKEECSRILSEISRLETAEENLENKTLKIIKNYIYDRKQENPDFLEGDFETYHRDFKKYLKHAVPNDLEPNERGTAILWLIKLSRENPDIAANIINGRITADRGRAMGLHVPNNLETFFHHKSFMPNQDLMQIKSLEDLVSLVDSAKKDIKKAQESRDYNDAEKGIERFRDDDKWKVYALHNKGAACALGKGTDWCTAAPGLDYFRQYYKKDDPLFYFEDLKNEERYQFHFGTEQYMDERDRDVGKEKLFKLFDLLVASGGAKKYPISNILFAKAPNTPPEVLTALSKDSRYEIRAAVAENPSVSPEALIILSKDSDLYVRRAVSWSSNLPPEALANLSRDSSEGLRVVAAKNKNTPPEALMALSKDPDQFQIRTYLAKNPSTPPEALMALSKDSNRTVVRYLATNPNTPPEALAILSKNSEDMFRSAVASNPNTPPEALMTLSKDSESMIRANAGGNPSTPPEALAILSKDSNSLIVRYVSQNPSTPPEVLSILSKDSGYLVRGSTAINPSTPPKALITLSRDSDSLVRRFVSENPNTPPRALAILSKDSHNPVRRYVAKNPTTPPEILAALSKDSNHLVRASIAMNPSTPPEALITLSKDSDSLVRMNVAANPSTPPEVLSILSKDSDYLARAATAINPSTPLEALTALLKDSKSLVRMNVAENPTYIKHQDAKINERRTKHEMKISRARLRQIIKEELKYSLEFEHLNVRARG